MAVATRLGVGSVLALAAAFAACSGGSGTHGSGGATSAGSTSSAGGAPSVGASSTGGTPSSTGLGCPASPQFVLPKGPCDLFLQNCADGQTCTIDYSPDLTTKCITSTGIRTAGEPCTGEPDAPDSDCAPKLICIGNTCAAVCCPDNAEPCNGGTCETMWGFGAAPVSVYICSYDPVCTLFAKDACPAGLNCHIDMQGVAICLAPLPPTMPDPCQYLADCGSMQECALTSDQACHYYCLLSGGASLLPGFGGCPAGETCLKSSDLGVPGVGLCSPPG